MGAIECELFSYELTAYLSHCEYLVNIIYTSSDAIEFYYCAAVVVVVAAVVDIIINKTRNHTNFRDISIILHILHHIDVELLANRN